MAGPVPERDQLTLMGRSPTVIYTCVTLLKGMALAPIAIIADDVFLSTAQIRGDIFETLCLLKEHLLDTADLQTIAFDTCGPSATKSIAESKSFVEGIWPPMEHTWPHNDLHQTAENARFAILLTRVSKTRSSEELYQVAEWQFEDQSRSTIRLSKS
jgi:hypothetical protein